MKTRQASEAALTVGSPDSRSQLIQAPVSTALNWMALRGWFGLFSGSVFRGHEVDAAYIDHVRGSVGTGSSTGNNGPSPGGLIEDLGRA